MECKINGVVVKVGQTWRQRDGDTEIIASFSRHNDWPIRGKSGAVYSSDGRYDMGDDQNDLISLLSEAPAESETIIGGGWYFLGDRSPPAGSFIEMDDNWSGQVTPMMFWDWRQHPAANAHRKWRYTTPPTVTADEKAAVTEAQQAALSANDVQHGGTHYKSKAIQPWDYIASNGLGYFEGNVVKYVSRWRDKGGLEDLRKAQHYLQKLIEVEGGAA